MQNYKKSKYEAQITYKVNIFHSVAQHSANNTMSRIQLVTHY